MHGTPTGAEKRGEEWMNSQLELKHKDISATKPDSRCKILQISAKGSLGMSQKESIRAFRVYPRPIIIRAE
jgi:hypothetical protein